MENLTVRGWKLYIQGVIKLSQNEYYEQNKDAKKLNRNQRYEENKDAEKLCRIQHYEQNKEA